MRLECAAAGLPQPDIYWTKDDLPVQSGGRFQVGTHNYYPLIPGPAVKREDLVIALQAPGGWRGVDTLTLGVQTAGILVAMLN